MFRLSKITDMAVDTADTEAIAVVAILHQLNNLLKYSIQYKNY